MYEELEGHLNQALLSAFGCHLMNNGLTFPPSKLEPNGCKGGCRTEVGGDILCPTEITRLRLFHAADQPACSLRSPSSISLGRVNDTLFRL